MSLWPNFRSPLLWDVFAVSTYATVSLLFWYLGMIPDLATLRDRATTKLRRFAYGVFSLGWSGSARAWHRYERAYLLLAALATPLVLSVHSVVSFDFAVVAGARLAHDDLPAVLRGRGHFQRLRDGGHAGRAGPGLLRPEEPDHHAAPGQHEQDDPGHQPDGRLRLRRRIVHGLVQRQPVRDVSCSWAIGRSAPTGLYWMMVTCNVLVPQLFWFKKCRTTPWIMLIIAILVNVGMWIERFVIMMSLTRDYLPSSWGMFIPTAIDIVMLVGSFGLFFTLFLLFCRYLPMVAMAEVKTVLPHGHKP